MFNELEKSAFQINRLYSNLRLLRVLIIKMQEQCQVYQHL